MTTVSSRPVIISHLVKVMREGLHLETDRETLKELSTFIKHSYGKSAAASGSHDDLVMASAIAHYMRRFQTSEMIIIDTGPDFLDRFFANEANQSNQYLEW